MAANLPVNATETRATFTIDISMITKEWQNYPAGQRVSSPPLDVGDLKAVIDVYPKSGAVRRSGWAIYMKIPNAQVGDQRLVTFSLSCGNDETKMTCPVTEFWTGLGLHSPFTKTALRANPKLKVEICLRQIQSVGQPSKALYPSFGDQLEKIYVINAESGDTKLIVSLIGDSIDDEKDTSCDSAPPRKRRKLNENEGETIDEGSHVDDNHNTNVHEANQPMEVRISSAVLRSASTVFDQMLSTDMTEKETKEIIVHAKSAKSVDDLAYFVTTNKLRNDANVLDILPLAHLYQIPSLFWECSERIIKNVNLDNYVETLNVLNKYDIKRGFPWMVRFGKKNIEALRERDDFEQLPCSFRTVALELSPAVTASEQELHPMHRLLSLWQW